ncbi:MAG: MFS transporter [Gammaproteobacteria bacterium]|nr:MFS transporter [Gammaproteobacteria bacterium]
MIRLILLVFTPVLSLIIFTLGSGLLTTLLTVRLHMGGGGPWIVGLLTAVYYLGLVLGSFLIGNMIKRVGHIRVYAACGSILAVATILQGMFANDVTWLVLRFFAGYCTAGIYVAIESWLLVVSPEKRRGQVLSIYMVSFYAALAGGQFFLNASNPATIIPFAIVTMLFSLSVVPLSMTRATCPANEDISALSLRKLYRISPSGVIGCVAGGLITSVVYGVMPLFVAQMNFSTSFVATIMATTIFGAMFIQYPVGRLSDFIERRKVLTFMSFTTLIVCVVLMIVSRFELLFVVMAFIFGGVSFTIYPLSINHACDYLEGRDIVAATQGLLFANGVGSIIGPLLVPEFIHVLGPLGLFVYFGLIAGLLGIFFSWRRTQKSSTPLEEQQDYVSVPRTPVATELDPRAEE